MTDAGDLRRQMTFASREPMPANADGIVEMAFVDRFTVSAQLVPEFGGEEVTAARMSGRNVATITVRRTPVTIAITTDWIAKDIIFNQTWNVRSPPIDPDQDGHFLAMLVEKGVAF